VEEAAHLSAPYDGDRKVSEFNVLVVSSAIIICYVIRSELETLSSKGHTLKAAGLP
jgi:hypothetical protein